MKWKPEKMYASTTLITNNDSIGRSRIGAISLICLCKNMASTCAAGINWDNDNSCTLRHMPHSKGNWT
jgi:hypothetical protein